jgi:hypothetical protein
LRLAPPPRQVWRSRRSTTVSGLIEQFVLRRFNLIIYGILLDGPSHFWYYTAQNVGTATLTAWMLLIVTGGWRAGRGWREWMGLGLGAAWLANWLWAILLEPFAQK